MSGNKFITQREVDFINLINQELVQWVVGQEVKYYSISVPETQVHGLYNEAVKKVWNAPVSINARVQWTDNSSTSTNLGIDSKPSCEVYFHTKELTDRNVVPHEGDFIEFGQVFFEIASIAQPQLVFGQVNNKIMTKCVCVPAREGQFQMGGEAGTNVDRSHPVENSTGENE